MLQQGGNLQPGVDADVPEARNLALPQQVQTTPIYKQFGSEKYGLGWARFYIVPLLTISRQRNLRHMLPAAKPHIEKIHSYLI